MYTLLMTYVTCPNVDLPNFKKRCRSANEQPFKASAMMMNTLGTTILATPGYERLNYEMNTEFSDH